MKTMMELLEGYRNGDPAAQEEVLARLEALLLPLVRTLAGKRIRADRDTVDLRQSLVMAFHLEACAGNAAFENEEALRAYLRTMIRNKLANVSDRIHAEKRGGGAVAKDIDTLPLRAFDPSASMVAATAELRVRIEGSLAEEERTILEGLLGGRTYAEIAAEMGKSPDAVRMTWNRARERLVAQGILDRRP